ncbi:MAG: G8 domain-containing protein [Bacteroidota bacterium]
MSTQQPPLGWYSYAFCFAFLCASSFLPFDLLAQKPWSDPASWPDGKLPQAGQNVEIPAGQIITLDISPPALGGLTIIGDLIFEDKDLDLFARWIWVQGSLQIGTEDQPFQHRASITLTGPEEDFYGMGGRFLCVTGSGSLELHGASANKRSWTVLAQNAKAGDEQIQLAADPDNWKVGDQIAIAPSGYDPFETEMVRITRIEGRQVFFEPRLQFEHWGQIQVYEGKSVDMRAEVGMLNRNILIQGADDAEALDYGGHTMIMGSTGPIHLEGVEFRRMGQPGREGRYNMHWHFSGVRKGDYVKNCSIHHGLQRGIVVHGTDDVLIESNVVYNVRNHAYVPAEDGNEVNNKFINNLSLLTRLPKEGQFAFPREGKETKQSTQAEHRPSGFWMRNVHNIFIGNHAAGAERGVGFFFDKSFRHRDFRHFDLLPQDIVFEDNVAHTNSVPGNLRNEGVTNHALYGQVGHGMGLFIDDFNNGDLIWIFRDFTAYKNGMGAVWNEMANVQLTDMILSDNPAALLTGPGEVKNTLVIGQSNNLIGNPHRYLRRGHHQTGYYTIAQGGSKQPRLHHVTFVNMNDGALGESAAIIADYKLSLKENHLSNIKLVNSTPVYMDTGGSRGKQPTGTFLNDADGSLSGYSRPVIIVPRTSPIARADFTRHDEWNGYVGTIDPLVRLTVHNMTFKNRIVLLMENNAQTHQSGNNTKTFNLRESEVYKWRYDDEEGTHEDLQLSLKSMTGQAGEWAAFEIPYPYPMASLVRADDKSQFPRFSSVSRVMGSDKTSFYFDKDQQKVFVRLITGQDGEVDIILRKREHQITNTSPTEEVEELISAFDWRLAPNPVIENAAISYHLPVEMPVRISLHDVLGKELLVLQDKVQKRGRHNHSLPLQDWPSGMYLIRFAPGDQSFVTKVTKQGR